MSTEPASDSRQKRGLRIMVVSVVVIGVASWFAWPRLSRWTQRRSAERSWAAAMQCLAATENIDDEQLRKRLIATALQPPAGEAWPASCNGEVADLAFKARVAADGERRCESDCCAADLGCQAVDGLVASSEQLVESLRRPAFDNESLRKIVDAGIALGWTLPPSQFAMPDEPLGHVALAELPVLSHHAISQAALCRMADPTWWLLLRHDARGSTFCGIDWGEALARCRALPVSVPSRGGLFLVDGGASRRPRLFHTDTSTAQLFSPSGDLVAELPPQTVGVTTLANDRPAALAPSGDGAYTLWTDGEVRTEVTATSPPLLYRGYVFVHAGAAITVQPIAGGPARELAKLPGDGPVRMRGCVATDVAAVRLRAADGGADSVAMYTGGRWHVAALPAGVPPNTMSCHGDAAHFTWIEAALTGPGVQPFTERVHDVRCDGAVCRARHGELSLPRRNARSRFFIAGLGDDVALIWRSPEGDVRAKIGPPGELGARNPIPVLEDAGHGGFAWDEAPVRVMSAERAALMLLTGDDGVRGVVLDGRGARGLTAAH